MDLQSSAPGTEKTSETGRVPVTVSIQLFKPGVRVVYNNQSCTVHHVMLSRGKIMVKLNELQEPVESTKLELSPTRLSLQRH